MADNETITDIIAEIRRRSDEAYNGTFNPPECQENQIDYDEASEWADRLEAANKRERGNEAKLREVCEKMLDLLTAEGFEDGGMSIELDEKQVIMWRNRFRAALSASPRNCDVYTSDELKVKFNSELASELPIANEHEKNLVAITAMGVIDTLLAPATEKEGGNK